MLSSELFTNRYRQFEFTSLRQRILWTFRIRGRTPWDIRLGRLPGIFNREGGRNRLIANNEVRAHSLHRTARLRLGISAKEFFIERADLHFGESHSKTEVLTGSEPDMRRFCACDVKAKWIGEDRFVTITRAIPEDYLVARTDRLIADEPRLQG